MHVGLREDDEQLYKGEAGARSELIVQRFFFPSIYMDIKYAHAYFRKENLFCC